MKLDPYKELGVTKAASPDEVKSAFRKRAKETHPDRGGNRRDFDRVTRANLVLSDPKRREKYNRTGDIDEDSPENAISAPVSIIVGLIQTVCQQEAQGAGDVTKSDLVTRMRMTIRDAISNLKGQQKSVEKIAKRMRVVADRMKKRGGGESLIHKAIRSQAASAETHINVLSTQIQAHIDAMTMLEEFEFEFDKASNPYEAPGFFTRGV